MTHMPYLQMVRGKWRVRVPVPENLRPHMPPPHTGKATLTRALGTGNDREANRLGVPVIAEFLGLIAKTEGRVNGLSELATLNNVDLGNPQQIHHASAVMQRFLSTLNLPVPACEIPKEPVTFPDMIELWSRGQHKKAIGNTTAKCGRFIYFLGHDDMARVTFINGREWRDEMVNEDELAPGSIANHLKAVKALFNYTCDNYPERLTVNVLDRVKYSPGDGASRDDFTPDERREILTLARRAEPHIYWSNWICSFHGNRNGEIADMSTRDIEITPEGIAVFNITTLNRSKDQRLKTPVSTRKLSLHQAVLDEGFIEYRDGVVAKHGHGPLFRDVGLDGYGRRAGIVTHDLSEWLRKVVKITDPRKPFYSHRHTATSILRNTLGENGEPVVKESVERYILGHKKKGSHDGYGGQWFRTLKTAVEVIPNPFGDEKDTSRAEAAE